MKRLAILLMFLACLIPATFTRAHSTRDRTPAGPRLSHAPLEDTAAAGLARFFSLSPLSSEVWAPGTKSRAFAAAAPVNSCTVECNNQYANCASFECGSPTAICSPCIEQLNQCLDACQSPPPDPPCTYVTTETEVHLTAQYYLGQYCLVGYGYPFQSPTVHELWKNVYTETTYRVTRNCNGTLVSREFQGSRNIERSCYFDTREGCSFREGSAPACTDF